MYVDAESETINSLKCNQVCLLHPLSFPDIPSLSSQFIFIIVDQMHNKLLVKLRGEGPRGGRREGNTFIS